MVGCKLEKITIEIKGRGILWYGPEDHPEFQNIIDDSRLLERRSLDAGYEGYLIIVVGSLVQNALYDFIKHLCIKCFSVKVKNIELKDKTDVEIKKFLDNLAEEHKLKS